MGKKMIINCATCDTRKVQEETLAAYDEICINAAMVVTSPASRALLARYPVAVNCANTLDVEGDVQISTVNGSAQIKSTDALVGKRYLMVNGSLEIGPDTQAVLQQYVGITVNGVVVYPESMSGYMGALKVNGTVNCYPDGAVVLKRNAVIDRTFALRAKNRLYWSAKRMIMVDDKLDAAVLTGKGATFSSKEVILAESKTEGLIDAIDEKAQITLVPDGTAVILDDVKLDAATVKKHGNKLYIIGDLSVEADSAQVLASLEYLAVKGDVTVHQSLEETLRSVAQEISGKVKIAREGKHICDRPSVRISRWLLEQEETGLLVQDCASVKLDPDVPKELILKRLSIEDCGIVVCTQEQEDAVSAVSEGVGYVGAGDEAGAGGIGKEALAGGLDDKVVNASEYIM